MPAQQLGTEGVARTFGDAWDGAEQAQLLFAGALSTKEKLAAPTPLPLSAAAAVTAPSAATVVSPIEDVVLLVDLWAFNNPAVDFSGASKGRGVPLSDSTFLVHRAASAAVFAAGLFSPSPTPSNSPSPSRTPFAGLLGGLPPSASPSNSPPAGDMQAPTGLTYTTPSGHLLAVESLTVTLTGTPSKALADALTTSPFNSAFYVANTVHTVTLPPNASLVLTIPAGTLRPGFVYRVSATARLRGKWAFVYGVPGWRFGAVAGGVRRRAAGEAPPPEEVAHVERLLGEFAGFQYNGSDVVVGLTATSARASLLYALAPPLGGTLAASPTFGTALTTNFVFTSGGWATTNAAALSATVPTDKVMAGELLMPPLPDDVIAALLPIAMGSSTDTIYNRVITGLLPTGAGVGAACAVTFAPGADPSTVAPAWHRAQGVLAAALSVARSELCAALVGNARGAALLAASSPAAGAGSYPPPGPLAYAFRGDNTAGGALPFGIADDQLAGSGALAPAAVLTPAVLLPLAAVANWPGFALAPPGASTALSLAWMFSPAGGGTGPVTVVALARDDCGLVGLSAVKVAMSPALSGTAAVAPAATAALGIAMAGTLAGNGLAATKPDFALQTVADVARLIAGAAPPAAAGDAASLAAAREALLTQVGAAVGALAATPSANTDGIQVEDGTLAAAAAAVAALTAAPSQLTPAAAEKGLAALEAVVPLAVPVAKGANFTVPLGTPLSESTLQALPPSTGGALARALSNVLSAAAVAAGGGAPSPSPAPGPLAAAAALGVEAAAPPLPSATLARVETVAGALGAAMLRAAPYGVPVTFSSADAPPGSGSNATGGAALGGEAAACGTGLAMSLLRVRVSARGGGPPAALALAAPLPPCDPAGNVTVPAAVAAAQAPPSITVPASTLTALAISTGAPALAVSILQFGTSPLPASAGVAQMEFPAAPGAPRRAAGGGGETTPLTARAVALLGRLPSSLAAARAAFTAPLPLAPGGAAAAARRRVWTVLDAFSSALAPEPLATAAALANAWVPPPSYLRDALPGRPMDSRVTSLTVHVAGRGAPLAVASTAAPFLVTLPLRDLSTVAYDTRSGTFAAALLPGYVPPVVNFTCPIDPATAAATLARAFFSAPPARAGARATVAVRNATPVTYRAGFAVVNTASTGYSVVDAPTAALVNVRSPNAPEGTLSTATGGLAAVPTGGAANGSLSADVVTISSWAFALGVDCGAPTGEQPVVCGPGFEGRAVAFACPALAPRAACVWWDGRAGGWSTAGCAVVGATATEVTCACDHLTAFSLRYAALPAAGAPGANVFATAAKFTALRNVDWAPGAVAVLATLACVGALVLGWGARADAVGGRVFSRVLAADEELVLLRRTRAIAGRPFVLDRLHPEITAVENTDKEMVDLLLTKPTAAGALAASVKLMQGAEGSDDVSVRERVQREAARALKEAQIALERGSSDFLLALFGQRLGDHFERVPVTVDGALRAVAAAAAEHSSHRGGAGGGGATSLLSDTAASSAAARAADDGDAASVNSYDSEDERERRRVRRVTLTASTARDAAAAATTRLQALMYHGGTVLYLLGRLTWARLRYVHPLLAPFTHHDPMYSRFGRCTAALAVVVGHFFWAALLYGAMFGLRGVTQVAPLTGAQIGLLMLAASAAALPVDFLAIRLLRAAGRAEFAWRYAELEAELAKRREAEYMLSLLSTPALADGADPAELIPPDEEETAPEAAAGGEVGDYLRAAVAAGLLPQASAMLAAAGLMKKRGARRGDGQEEDDPPEGGSDDDDGDGATSQASGSSMLDPEAEEGEIRGALSARGWTEVPPVCEIFCGWLVYLCGRHSVSRQAHDELAITSAELAVDDAVHYMAAAGALPPRAPPRRICAGLCWSYRPPLPGAVLHRARRRLVARGRVAPAPDADDAADAMPSMRFTAHVMAGEPRTRSDAVTEALLSARLAEMDDDADLALSSWRCCSFDAFTALCCAPTVNGRRVPWNFACGCPAPAAAAYAAVWLYICVSAAAVGAFNLINGAAATNSLLAAWAAATVWSGAVVAPLCAAAATYASLLLWPRVAPLVAWLPWAGEAVFGAAVAARASPARAGGAHPTEGLLTTRLQYLVVSRAAAAAAGAPRDMVIAAVGLRPFMEAAIDPTAPPPPPDGVRFDARTLLRRALILRKYVLLPLRAALGLYASLPQALAAAALLASDQPPASTSLAAATVPLPRARKRHLLFLTDGDDNAAEALESALRPPPLVDATEAILEEASAPAGGAQAAGGEAPAEGGGDDDEGEEGAPAVAHRSGRPAHRPRSSASRRAAVLAAVAAAVGGGAERGEEEALDDDDDDEVAAELAERRSVARSVRSQNRSRLALSVAGTPQHAGGAATPGVPLLGRSAPRPNFNYSPVAASVRGRGGAPGGAADGGGGGGDDDDDGAVTPWPTEAINELDAAAKAGTEGGDSARGAASSRGPSAPPAVTTTASGASTEDAAGVDISRSASAPPAGSAAVSRVGSASAGGGGGGGGGGALPAPPPPPLGRGGYNPSAHAAALLGVAGSDGGGAPPAAWADSGAAAPPLRAAPLLPAPYAPGALPGSAAAVSARLLFPGGVLPAGGAYPYTAGRAGGQAGGLLAQRLGAMGAANIGAMQTPGGTAGAYYYPGAGAGAGVAGGARGGGGGGGGAPTSALLAAGGASALLAAPRASASPVGFPAPAPRAGAALGPAPGAGQPGRFGARSVAASRAALEASVARVQSAGAGPVLPSSLLRRSARAP